MDQLEDLLYREVGRLIRQARKGAGLTQDELADKVQMARTSITNIEYGQQKVQLHTLYALAEVLNIAVKDLLPTSQITRPKNDVDWLVREKSVFTTNGRRLEGLNETERELILSLMDAGEEPENVNG